MNPVVKDKIKLMNSLASAGEAFFFMIDFKQEKPLVLHQNELGKEGIEIDIPGFGNAKNNLNAPGDFYFRKFPVEPEIYRQSFEKVIRAIHRGDTFLLNLTFPTRIETNLTLDDIYRFGRAKYKLKFRDEFVVFSPEPFISTYTNTISTYPMKGTIDASIAQAERVLMTDPKEIAEHNTIVDLLRNDLNMVAERVKVESFRYVEKIRTHEKEILQTSSKISGQLKPAWQNNIGDLIFKLLPAGSISGAPKKKTVEIIEDAEADERGYFTGVFGYFNGVDLETAVMIRYIEQNDNRMVFRSGGGITSFSVCEKEYSELIDKVYVPVFRDHTN
ncbi:MAG: aminodeoxychorismate synthase component I [Bacteroidales bacterium]|nr:aminodeoxychorismate synthase component I [Bacteroidales bacterium]